MRFCHRCTPSIHDRHRRWAPSHSRLDLRREKDTRTLSALDAHRGRVCGTPGGDRPPLSRYVSPLLAAYCGGSLRTRGRRGLFNLGQTCFLNVILQCFIHNPLLRNYFLGDRHNTRLCKNTEYCTCCEMDGLFAEVSNLSSFPGSPTNAMFRFIFLPWTWNRYTLRTKRPLDRPRS